MVVMKRQFEIMILILLMSSLTIITGGSVSMCRNDTYTATNYQPSRLHSDPTNCTCLLKSTEQTTTRVLFNILALYGCRYKLGFYLNSSVALISCTYSAPLFYTITSETIKLNLEPDRQNGTTSSFILNITSTPETNLTLSCFVPTIKTSSTQLPTTTITSTHQPTTTSAATTKTTTSAATTKTTIISSTRKPTTPNTTKHQPTSTNTNESQLMESITFTKTTQLSKIITTTSTSQNSSDEQTEQEEKSSDDSTVGIAVGCFIGGIVFGIIVVLGLLWFRLKRQKKEEIYSTPTNREDHTYASIIPGTEVGNMNTTGETTRTSSDAMGEATVATDSTGGNRTNNPSVTYQNVSNNPYLNV